MRNTDKADPVLGKMARFVEEQHMLPRGSRVLCAVSGGADSICLLHALLALKARLGIEIFAAHYDHMLRGEESRRDAGFVRHIAEQWGVKLLLGQGDVSVRAKEAGRGIEETAREMRYTFLEQAAQQMGADRIATAHNANDNGETILMHLLRGSGLRGLTGIPPVRGNIIRPLLTVSRQEIEDYLRRHELTFVEDSTNGDDTYTRNRLRHRVFPELEAICPGVLDRMGRMAQSLRADEEYLQAQGRALLEKADIGGEALRLPAGALAQAPDAVALRAIRMALGACSHGNQNCTAAHLSSVLELCQGNSPSAQVDLPDGLTARREYGMLVLTRREVSGPIPPTPLNLPGDTQVEEYRVRCEDVVYQGERQEKNVFFLSQRLVRTLLVRSRQTGDHLTRPGRKGKTVKKLLIDEKIPLSRRDGLPVLETEGRVAAVAELGVDHAFLPQAGEKAWKLTLTSERKFCK